MNGVIIFVKRLPASGMTLFPFILIHKKSLPLNEQLLNHERIHLQQQIELLILPFYIWYLAEYICYRLKGKDHKLAYQNIRFEKEAYLHDKDQQYLNKRKRWAFMYF
jgi:hypothetical protein